MRIQKYLLLASAACALSFSTAYAEDDAHAHHHDHSSSTADAHAPIGVMGEHMHDVGDFMLSYRYMHMDMDGSRKGTNEIDTVTIATTEENRFSGMAGQPTTLRIVPTSMTMDMHMLGGMYAPTDWLTLMLMVNYIEKEMDHTTFAGGAGTAIRGTFTTKSDGWGDTKLSGLIKLLKNKIYNVHLNLGISFPTGGIDKTATTLTPMGATPRLRMPYSMQLGTGTYDLLPGITYVGHKNDWGWGAQYTAEIRLEDENDESYAWGDKHALTVWGSYEWAPWISTSARVNAYTQGDIDGLDPNIVAPVQTADPDNYGGDVIELSLGTNLLSTKGVMKGHRLAVEATAPLYRNLNGPQLETDWSVMFGWQYAF